MFIYPLSSIGLAKTRKRNGGTMAESWVLEEMRTIDLKDKRTNARLNEVLTQLSERPTASIPTACGGHAEMTAAYRLFDNEKATFDRILMPHAQATRKRMGEQKTVLLPQDTTENDLTRPIQIVKGAGPLDGGHRRGMLLHLLHAFTPDGTPLGTVGSSVWVRGEEKINATLSRAERAAIPIKDKESYRWLDERETRRFIVQTRRSSASATARLISTNFWPWHRPNLSESTGSYAVAKSVRCSAKQARQKHVTSTNASCRNRCCFAKRSIFADGHRRCLVKRAGGARPVYRAKHVSKCVPPASPSVRHGVPTALLRRSL